MNSPAGTPARVECRVETQDAFMQHETRLTLMYNMHSVLCVMPYTRCKLIVKSRKVQFECSVWRARCNLSTVCSVTHSNGRHQLNDGVSLDKDLLVSEKVLQVFKQR